MKSPWQASVSSGIILGLVVGLPYYSMPFFYDYFEHPVSAGGYGWRRASIQLGLPLGTLVTLAAGPLFAHRVPVKAGILSGAVVCAAAVAGFGATGGNIGIYYACWMLYMAGWTFAGPMQHQVLLSRLFERNRGSGLAIAFFGISLFGALSVACVARPLALAFGYTDGLKALGAIVLLAVPVAGLGLSGISGMSAPAKTKWEGSVLRSRVLWMLMGGSTLTAAGIAGVIQHLKLILRERGHLHQSRLDEVFGTTLLLMLACSAMGRFAFAWSADRFSKRRVITVAFLLMLAAMPLLYQMHSPYLFGILFGCGMSADSLLVTLLAAEHYGSREMAKPMSVLVPVNTVGQTWFPYVVSLLWEVHGSYAMPLAVIFTCILGGRLLLSLAPGVEKHGESV